VNWVVS